ncbi:MAG: succinate dehydrogenase assembly factor 2 [Legionella sp.]|nr:succinate dehydrogenase assembly factor 2 [Legionella sp.]
MIDPTRKAKIRWQCRRGMLELDLILAHFIDKGLENLTGQQLDSFESLLTAPDPVLYSWLMGSDHPENRELMAIVELVQMHYKTR